MSSSKKRKLDFPTKSPQLSAFAARKALHHIGSSPRDQNGQSEDAQTKTSRSNFLSSKGDSPVQAQSQDRDVILEVPQSKTEIDNDIELSHDENVQSSSIESRAESPKIPIDRPVNALSSFRPNKSNFNELEEGDLRIRLAPGERLVVLGQYKLAVRKGQITLMGSTLQASETLYPVFGLSSHSLPVIRCLATELDDAEVILCQYRPGLEELGGMSPLFANLGNKTTSSLGAPFENMLQKPLSSSFQILFSSEDSQRTFVQPIVSAPEWNATLAKCSADPIGTRPSVVMLCGPKSSGKSTFAKLLTNKLLLSPVDAFDTTIKRKQTGVALLDIDPGQPEYSPPGQLALLHIQTLNFGPPFAHPLPGSKNRIIHSHSIGALSPAIDTTHYMACVANLISHYQHLQLTMPGCPLVINTPGWVLGTGLEILVELITRVKPTNIIYMSLDGPPEVVSRLKEAAKLTPVFTLPSQVSEYTTRTAAHLRTMQYMSYFHMKSDSTNLSWSEQPLSSIPPWEIRYSGENPGILGIMCYGEQPPPELLTDTINGSLVAVVVIDDMSAIPGWPQTEKEGMQDEIPDRSAAPQYTVAGDIDVGDLEDYSFQPHLIHTPLILSTPKESMPYFNPANPIALHPQHSHSIGLALVRGIDVARQRLQILTPISPSIIQEVNDAGKRIVLVSGKLDTPGWAYTEALLFKTSRENTDEQDEMTTDGGDDDDDVKIQGTDTLKMSGNERDTGNDFGDVPWVEQLQGSQGRGIGSRVWRVRRDLGKQDDGGN